MSLLTRLFGQFSGTPVEPWTVESAYKAISSRIDPSSGRLTGDDSRLPDDEALDVGSKIRWAPGAEDGVLGHHSSPDDTKATAARLAKLVDEVARTGDRRAIAAAYAIMKEGAVLGLVDPLIQLLGERASPIEPHLSQFALKLATESADRGPVKVGIALLGVTRLSQHRQVVETLGLHDEFTLFSAVALGNMLDQPETALWQLASKLDGWGRIQIVERLVPTESAEIQRWLRTEGFRNSILYEYLALIAATHGKLRAALDRASVPASELVAAGEIIASMIAADHGPCAGMNSYSDAAATCLLYLGHVESAPPDLLHFKAIHALLDYLTSDDRPEAERLVNGWSESAVAEALQVARKIIAPDAWGALIRDQLDATDPMAFHLAADAATKAGIDPFPWHWKRLQDNPTDPGAWSFVMQHMNADRIDSALWLAEKHLPLNEIATGPADEMGFGAEFNLHSCLDAIVQDLRAYPGKGSRLIAAGLMSPVVRNRHMAISALDAWGRMHWNDDIREALERARASEMHEDVSKRLNALLT